MRLNIIDNTACPNSDCIAFYSDLLAKSFTEARKLKFDINFYYPEYLQIFFKTKSIVSAKKYKADTESFPLDIDNYINFLTSNGLKIIANLSDYFDSKPFLGFPGYEILDVYLDNLLSTAYSFFYKENYNPFEGEEKTRLLNSHSNNFPIRLIIALFSSVLIISIMIYLDCRIYSTECFFLDKLMNFNSVNFDEYLKRLDELKKTLRDENNDDEDKNMDDEGEEDLEGKEENNSNNNKEKDMKMKLLKKKENPKKKKNKQNKIHIQKLKKRKNMSNHFFRINLFFIIKIAISFILLIIYFITTIILFDGFKKDYIQFDESLVQINSIYLNIYKTFLIFKKEIENLVNDSNYEIVIPDDSQLIQPKLGNTLFNIIHN